jgi:preprotein translocase subunit SecA
VVPRLRPEEDYEVDEKQRTAAITESGVTKVEQALNIYEAQMKKGVVYYDTRRINPPVILHDRAALLQTFVRDGQIGRPAT